MSVPSGTGPVDLEERLRGALVAVADATPLHPDLGRLRAAAAADRGAVVEAVRRHPLRTSALAVAAAAAVVVASLAVLRSGDEAIVDSGPAEQLPPDGLLPILDPVPAGYEGVEYDASGFPVQRLRLLHRGDGQEPSPVAMVITSSEPFEPPTDGPERRTVDGVEVWVEEGGTPLLTTEGVGLSWALPADRADEVARRASLALIGASLDDALAVVEALLHDPLGAPPPDGWASTSAGMFAGGGASVDYRRIDGAIGNLELAAWPGRLEDARLEATILARFNDELVVEPYDVDGRPGYLLHQEGGEEVDVIWQYDDDHVVLCIGRPLDLVESLLDDVRLVPEDEVDHPVVDF
jgi:hypothetical protein